MKHRKWIIWSAVVLVLLSAVIVLPIQMGKWYWKQVREELTAKGEKLFAPEFQKPPIAEKDNYFAIPFFYDAIKGKSGTQYRQLKDVVNLIAKERKILSEGEDCEVGAPVSLGQFSRNLPADATEEAKSAETLAWLQKQLEPLESIRGEILKEAKRPNSDAFVNLEEGFSARLEFVSPALSLSKFCRLHALAALARGDTASAMEDIAIIYRTAQAVDQEPMVISKIVGMAVRRRGEATICDGMPLWTEDELQRLAAMLASHQVDPKKVAAGLRTERSMFNTTILNCQKTGRGFVGVVESGFLVNNYAYIPQANYNLALQALIEMVEASSALPSDFDAIALKSNSNDAIRMWPHLFEKLSVPGLVRDIQAVYRSSDETRLLQAAIALEQFHRRNGKYPNDLSELVPTFLASIPTGSIPGQTIQYLPLRESGYKLWTFGWNGTDERGTPARRGRLSDDWTLTKEP